MSTSRIMQRLSDAMEGLVEASWRLDLLSSEFQKPEHVHEQISKTQGHIARMSECLAEAIGDLSDEEM